MKRPRLASCHVPRKPSPRLKVSWGSVSSEEREGLAAERATKSTSHGSH